MSRPAQRAPSFRRVWTLPLLLAVLTTFGLLAALLGTGPWRGAAWLALALPIIVGLRYSLFAPPASRPRKPR